MRLFLLLFLLTPSLHAAPKIIAHRGASEKAPENTLAAFQAAWKEGADGIEADFRLSKDGRVVCIHDEDTHRTTGRKLVVAETPWELMRTLDAGSWKHRRYSKEHLPLFEEVLAIVPPGKFFFVEIKSGPETVAPLARLLKGADPKRVFLISFNAEVVAECRKKLPNFQVHWISHLDQMHQKNAERTYLGILDAIDATGLQFSRKARVSDDFLNRVRRADRLTACWTINKVSTAKQVAARGVDFITTDRPAAIRKGTGWTK
ncbi:MAG: glycerophosphodiester phosphodiesterase family protein [Verrucomicrobiota bacterium]